MELLEQIRVAQQGDQQVLSDLCFHFKRVVRRYVNRSHLQVLQEEAVAVGQLAVVQAISNYNPVTKVPIEAYVEQRVKYAIWNLFKRERRFWQHTLSYDVANPDDAETDGTRLDTIADEFDLEEAVAASEFQANFRKRIQTLPYRQQQVLRAVIAGFTLVEIGRELHITPQAVCQIKFRAQNRLKRNGLGMEESVGR